MQYKQIVNPSFLVAALELQDMIKDGWEIDPDNLPVNNLMYFEISLRKEDKREEVKKVLQELADVSSAPKRGPKPKGAN